MNFIGILSLHLLKKRAVKVVEGSKKWNRFLNVMLLNLSSIRLKIPIRNILNQQKMVNVLFMLILKKQRLYNLYNCND